MDDRRDGCRREQPDVFFDMYERIGRVLLSDRMKGRHEFVFPGTPEGRFLHNVVSQKERYAQFGGENGLTEEEVREWKETDSRIALEAAEYANSLCLISKVFLAMARASLCALFARDEAAAVGALEADLHGVFWFMEDDGKMKRIDDTVDGFLSFYAVITKMAQNVPRHVFYGESVPLLDWPRREGSAEGQQDVPEGAEAVCHAENEAEFLERTRGGQAEEGTD